MRRNSICGLTAGALLLIGIVCLAQQSSAQLTMTGVGGGFGGAATNNTSFDGACTNAVFNAPACALTTANSGDLIIAVVGGSAGTDYYQWHRKVKLDVHGVA
jgi:hypothetical protein